MNVSGAPGVKFVLDVLAGCIEVGTVLDDGCPQSCHGLVLAGIVADGNYDGSPDSGLFRRHGQGLPMISGGTSQ